MILYTGRNYYELVDFYGLLAWDFLEFIGKIGMIFSMGWDAKKAIQYLSLRCVPLRTKVFGGALYLPKSCPSGVCFFVKGCKRCSFLIPMPT